MKTIYSFLAVALGSISLERNLRASEIEAYQTTREGDRLKKVESLGKGQVDRQLKLDPSKRYQTLLGVGGSFTEAAAHALSELTEARRNEVIKALFSPEGAHYSLVRTPIASCDFSVTNFTYAPVPDDLDLKHFTIEKDRKYLLPMIQAAQKVEGADFEILASPWTAAPWMKTNNTWNGGELKKEHYPTFANYIVKYIEAYRKEGIDIWGITPVNEPLGNGSNWESMHFTSKTMSDFIGGDLGPAFEKAGLDVKIWAYDQNRDKHLLEWADAIYGNPEVARYVDGMGVHWYQSTSDIGAPILDELHKKFPQKQIIHSEGCIDAMGDDEKVGVWLEDDWYWRAEATDWGYRWAPEEEKKDHPKYRPFYRYARDLIGGLNHHFTGWVDWNMILNTRGGPNHARNFCLAPIMVDSGRDSVYMTPLYYAVAHVSRFIRPGAKRIHLSGHDESSFMATAFKNTNGSVVVVVFNLGGKALIYSIELAGEVCRYAIPGQALQTIVLKP